MHCDTILKLMDDEDKGLYENDLNVDIKKLKKANSLAQFFAVWVDLKNGQDPMETCLKMIDRFYREIENNSSHISLATSYEDIMKNDREGRISAILTIEEGAAIKGAYPI